MKILHIIGSMDPASGGPCQGIRNSDEEMNRLGSNREVISLDDPSSAFLGKDSFPVHALGPPKTSWKYTSKLKPWLIENASRFDVIVVNGIWLYSSFTALRIIRLLKKDSTQKVPKLFVMPHGMLDPYFQRAGGRRLKALRNFIYWHLIEKHVINNADGILFTCEMELQLAKQTFAGYYPKREINVGYGIMPPPIFSENMQKAFKKNCAGIGDRPYFLFLSRINEKKGVDILIEAYAALLKRKDLKVTMIPALVIAGPGIDTPYGKKIIELIDLNPILQNNLFLISMLTGNAKWGALHGCEAFLLPSHQENFGIAIVEAMACKKAVLISDQVNIWLEIKNAGAGIVVHDNLEGAKDLLDQWMNMQHSEQLEMGLRAYGAFQKFFNVKHNAAVFLEALSS